MSDYTIFLCARVEQYRNSECAYGAQNHPLGRARDDLGQPPPLETRHGWSFESPPSTCSAPSFSRTVRRGNGRLTRRADVWTVPICTSNHRRRKIGSSPTRSPGRRTQLMPSRSRRGCWSCVDMNVFDQVDNLKYISRTLAEYVFTKNKIELFVEVSTIASRK